MYLASSLRPADSVSLSLSVGILAGASLITTNPGGYSGWRSMFWIIAAAHFVSLVLIFFSYHPPAPPNPEGKTVMARILVRT